MILTMLRYGFNMLIRTLEYSRSADRSDVRWEVSRMMVPSFVPSEELVRVLMNDRSKAALREGEIIRLNRIFHRANRGRKVF